MLSIVETLKEFKTIVLGYEVEIHTDHKNVAHEMLLMLSDRVMWWRLIIEEYGPQLFLFQVQTTLLPTLKVGYLRWMKS